MAKITTVDRIVGTGTGAHMIYKGMPIPDSLELSSTDQDFVEAGDLTPGVVEVSPIGPTGPNPTMPQQLPHDAVQTAGGYAIPGANLVGEVTNPADTRFAAIDRESTAQGDITSLMDSAESNAAEAKTGSEMTATDLIDTLGGKTNGELDDLRTAEVDRDKPRKTVLNAIDAEKALRDKPQD